MRRLREEVGNINTAELKTLRAVYSLSKDYNYIPLTLIQNRIKGDVENITRSLAGKKMIQRRKKDYEGVRLTFKGLSVLALKTLSEMNVLSSIGSVVDTGKESVIYDGLSESGGEVIIKFHRVGATSFKKVKEKREYYAHSWIVLSSISAMREYRCLLKLSGVVNVPRPYGCAYNAVVMERIDGRELSKTFLEDPEFFLGEVLNQIRGMYRLGVVHGDLSEFNILIADDAPYIIDLPQYLNFSSPGGKELLERDVYLVLKHFRKKYGIELSLESALKYVRGENGRDNIWS